MNNGGASDASYAQTSAPAGTVMVTPAANTASSVVTLVNRVAGDPAGLIPAGVGGVAGGVQYADRPLSYALDDAKAAAIASINADAAATRSCRNVIVVLITGGKDSGDAGYTSANDVAARATQFTSISATGVTGKHVPIHVIGIKVPAAEESQLQSVATNSGGVYHNVTTKADLTAWINYAVQAGYARSADVNAAKPSEFTAVSPVVGTVNLTGAEDATGAALPNDVVHLGGSSTAAILPQRSNVMLTGNFELPGFYGRLRAFRVYKPVADSTQPSGYKFIKDGTRLWPDLDGRPSLAGQARTPADPNTRNIYTYVPDGSGGGSMMAFTTANASTLATHLNVSAAEATTLITLVRAQPLGAIIGSTPAMMDTPSLDPPPDDDYGRADATGTFAGDHADRRALIFVGANDGMMHAIDARTGYEVWAFIPYNLLPKLRTLSDGQPVEQFEDFVDSSPKLAEVKLDPTNSNPALRWRSLLLFGEGPGGTFYQCFDVTEAGMGVDPASDGLTAVTSLLQTFDTAGESIGFKWAFPNYNHFDPTFKQTFTLADGTAGGKLTLWGDVNASATYAEKTVGFSWSDPAIGPLNVARTVNAVVVGSGYFPDIETLIPNRGVSGPKAGTTLYLINADTGVLVGNSSRRELRDHANGRDRLSVGGRCVELAQERAPGGPDGGRPERLAGDRQGLSRRHRREILALQLHVGWRAHGLADARHGLADLCLVCVEQHHQHHRRLHVLCHGQRYAAADDRGGDRDFQVVRLEGQRSRVGRHDEVRDQPCDGVQHRRPGQRRARVGLAIDRRRHRVLHDHDRNRDHAVRRVHLELACPDVHRHGRLRRERQREDRQQRDRTSR